MLLERTEMSIKAGLEDEFESVMRERGLPMLIATPGVISAQLGRGVESPTKFLFLVQWDNLDSHAAFNRDPQHPEFLKLFGPYAEGGAMEHFQMR